MMFSIRRSVTPSVLLVIFLFITSWPRHSGKEHQPKGCWARATAPWWHQRVSLQPPLKLLCSHFLLGTASTPSSFLSPQTCSGVHMRQIQQSYSTTASMSNHCSNMSRPVSDSVRVLAQNKSFFCLISFRYFGLFLIHKFSCIIYCHFLFKTKKLYLNPILFCCTSS